MYLSKRSLILAASLALSAGAAFPQAPAAESQAPAHERHARGAKRFAELNLTDAQKEQAKTIREKYRASSEDLRTQMRTLREQLKAAKDANNTAEIERLTQQHDTLAAKAKETFTAQRDEFRSILTAEQQAKFDKVRDRHNHKQQSEKPQA